MPSKQWVKSLNISKIIKYQKGVSHVKLLKLAWHINFHTYNHGQNIRDKL